MDMRKVSVLVLAVVAMGVMSMQAEARRLRIPVVIPGFGSSEQIVRVVDLPDIAALKRDDGTYVDLGYLHKRSGGEWVGYVGSSETYIKLTEEKLNALLAVGGLKKLPPVPQRTASSGGVGSWFGIGIVALAVLGFCMRLKGFFDIFVARVNAGRTRRPVQEQHEDPSYGDEAIARALASRMAAPVASHYSASAAAPAFGKQATFGRR
jgi:hypothetical protein